jgi:hypothetical protein
MPKGYVDLKVLFGKKPGTKAVMTRFSVVNCPSAYKAILGRPTLNHLGAIVSTIHLAMKFHGEDGSVITVRGKGSDARRCYQESLKITKTPVEPAEIHEGKGKNKMERRDFPQEAGIMMNNLDPRADSEEQRPQPEGHQILVQIGHKEDQTVKVGANFPPVIKGRLIELLKRNKGLFAWVLSEMPGVKLDLACHRLSIKPGCTPVA